MKDRAYIISKLIIRHAIPLMLLIIAGVLFFVNFFNKPVAYATEMIANVNCSVNVVSEDDVKNISSDNKLITNMDESIIKFSNIDIKLTAKSYVEVDYSIENVTNRVQTFVLDLVEIEIENFNIEYSIDNGERYELNELKYDLDIGQSVDIKVFVSIDKICADAILDGSLNLTFNEIGEING